MARLLKTTLGKFALAISLAVVLITAFVVGKSVYAASVYGRFTGYAMGTSTGAFGVPIDYGTFANHPSWSSCYEGWGYNTRIVTPQTVTMHVPPGWSIKLNQFFLKDRGDENCYEQSYWVDLYFGRAKWSSQTCYCPGSNSPQVCINGSVNNCQDASNFGYRWWTYSVP